MCANKSTSGPENDVISDDIEFILSDLGGSFGKFQLRNYIIFSVAISISGLISLVYVFTALNIEYRCYIPECDDIDYPQYHTDWLENVVPFTQQALASKCHRYERMAAAENGSKLINLGKLQKSVDHRVCPKASYNRSSVVPCEADGFIYRTDEISIANEFDITCEENEWRLASVGAYNNVARLVCLPLVSVISDRFGRRKVLMFSLLLSSIAGIIQSFSINYTMFVVCEIFSAGLSSPIFTAALLLGLEWASAPQRVLVSATIAFPVHIGIAICGVLASYIRDFRPLLRCAYGPAMVTAVLIFFGPESIQWLLAKGKPEPIKQILNTAARVNKRRLSARTFDIVDKKCHNQASCTSKTTDENSINAIFSSWSLMSRVCINSLCWITGNYIAQGINIIAVSLHGDKYFNFVILSLGSLPSGFISILLLRCVGRRNGISLCLVSASVTVMAGQLLPIEYSTLSLILYMSSRCFGSVAFLIVYIHTSELWPTNVRHTMMGISATLGRIGGILAPLAPLLSSVTVILPFVTFAAMSMTTGLLVLFLPETIGESLPVTIEDAKNLGKKRNSAK